MSVLQGVNYDHNFPCFNSNQMCQLSIYDGDDTAHEEVVFEVVDDTAHEDETTAAMLQIPAKELLKSMLPRDCLLTFGYIRENAFKQNDLNITVSIIHYIAIFAFYSRGALYQYTSDFDRNGIVYAIATHYGLTKWDNPARQDLIRIDSSGWSSGRIENVLNRRKPRNACYSANKTHSWFSIDFGEQKKIKPTHYTLRDACYCCGAYLQEWNLEGSNDGQIWDVLRKHCDDTHLHSINATHTWTVNGNEYYQMFRIIMTGQNSFGMWQLHCSGFEIYGYLTHLLYKQ
eukprot:971438_1